MVSFVLVVCIIIGIHVFAQDETGNYGQTINWEPFEIQDSFDRDGMDIIKGLPLYQFWDVLKGSFRTGLIGDVVFKSHPQFVSVLEKKGPKVGAKLNTAADNYAVDFPALYMYSLLALQHLIEKAENLTMTYERSTGLQSEKGHSYELVYQKSFASKEETGLLKMVLHQRKRRLELFAATLQEHYAAEEGKLSLRNATKLADMQELHEVLQGGQREHFATINDSRTAKYVQLGVFANEHEIQKRYRETTSLVDQYSDEVAQLKIAINVTMKALKFRAAEELRVALQQQQFEEQELLGTKSELLQAEVEEVINAFFAELYQWGHRLAEDPSAAISAAKLLLAGVGALLLALELRQLCLSVMQKLAGASYYPTVVRMAAADVDVGGSRDLRWCAAVEEQVAGLVRAMSTAACHQLPLPNLLVVGSSGTGKSALVKRIVGEVAAACGSRAADLRMLPVCGADLLALGDAEAALFLNELIRKHSNAHRLVIVIDDADCIVASRELHRQQPPVRPMHGNEETIFGVNTLTAGRASACGCLISLLAGLRENSPHIALILTARLAISQVDSALLDRIDTSISLLLPSESERLRYAVTALAPLMDKLQSVGAVDSAVDLEGLAGETSAVRALQQALLSGAAADTRRAAEMLRSADLRAMRVLADAWPVVGAAGALSAGPHSGGRANEGSAQAIIAIASTGGADPDPDPETDRPVGTRGDERNSQHQNLAQDAGEAASASPSPSALAALRRRLSALPSGSLDVLLCLRIMCLLSNKWSYRDLKQFFSSLNYVIMCSERCELTTKVWLRELLYAFD